MEASYKSALIFSLALRISQNQQVVDNDTFNLQNLITGTLDNSPLYKEREREGLLMKSSKSKRVLHAWIQ